MFIPRFCEGIAAVRLDKGVRRPFPAQFVPQGGVEAGGNQRRGVPKRAGRNGKRAHGAHHALALPDEALVRRLLLLGQRKGVNELTAAVREVRLRFMVPQPVPCDRRHRHKAVGFVLHRAQQRQPHRRREGGALAVALRSAAPTGVVHCVREGPPAAITFAQVVPLLAA